MKFVKIILAKNIHNRRGIREKKRKRDKESGSREETI
jgi:hypothetical protein